MKPEAEFIIAVLEKAADNAVEASDTVTAEANTIIQAYGVYKRSMDFVSAAHRARVEWLAAYLQTVMENH